MISTPLKLMAVIALTSLSAAPASAKDVTVTIPLRSKLSPVQRLNREGVEAVKKHQFAKAEALFYKAYLYDPADPFTLNNLGFVSEFEGQLEQAHKFYQLAAEQSCDAHIDKSSIGSLENKPMRAALEGLEDLPMRINRMNVEAMRLLSQDRGFEAVALLQQAVALEPENPFTLNNLAVADEAIGDYSGALKNYDTVANSHSSEPVEVTQNRAWAGRPVSAMAQASAKRLQRRMRDEHATASQAAMFNLRGVFAANQNNWAAADQDFLRAYSIDPANAFSLDNRGYVAERQGDLESAQFFYGKARRAADAGNRVGLATDRTAEGHSLLNTAEDSDRKVDDALDVYSRERHTETAPVELTPRGAGATPSVATPPSTPAAPPLNSQPTPPPSNQQPPKE
jgi:Flp pilus assembly protein TadD